METFLIVVTVISIGIAVAALFMARRLQAAERQRSEARIATLAAAAETHGATDGGWKQVAGEWQWVAAPSARPVRFDEVQFHAEPPSSSDARAAEEPAPAIAFGTVQRGEATTGRLPIFAAAVLILILGSAMLFLRTSGREDATSGAPVATQTVSPLELLSLGHNREPKSLTITGTIRNPASGHKVEGLTAVVSLLDNKGALISTKDVPLDYRALGPGEEAPFTVSVPDPGAIARYRVSFRAGAEVVPHVDRRAETKLASSLR